MSIFSKLSGTMQRVFMIGKRGIKITSTDSELQIKSNDETTLVPVSGANPSQNTHFVTLEYFNNNNTGGGGGGATGILKGTADPSPSLGVEGNVYFKVDGTEVLEIFIKDTGVWKVYKPDSSSGAVYQKLLNVSDWTVGPTESTIVIPQSEHLVGVETVSDVFENVTTAETSSAPYRKTLLEVVVADNGDVTLKSLSPFSGKIVITGK